MLLSFITCITRLESPPLPACRKVNFKKDVQIFLRKWQLIRRTAFIISEILEIKGDTRLVSTVTGRSLSLLTRYYSGVFVEKAWWCCTAKTSWYMLNWGQARWRAIFVSKQEIMLTVVVFIKSSLQASPTFSVCLCPQFP